MIPAILIGRGGSIGLPNKNVKLVLGRPLMAYPLLAAKNSKFIDKVYVSTDSDQIKKIAKDLDADVIDRPQNLATSEATVEEVFVHAYKNIKKNTEEKIELVVILMCNAVSVFPETIEKGIKILREKKEFDSAVTVSGFNMYTPIRARKIDKDGSLVPFIPLENFNFKIDSNRQKQDTVYFHDCGVSVVRPFCLEDIENGLLPQKWMGKKIYPLTQNGVLDVDYDYEIKIAENWLKSNGFTSNSLPYKKK
tara:strand:+ start:1899 stop:2648 length:750 start_codon:yes stop_codon:yes gene_type:complete